MRCLRAQYVDDQITELEDLGLARSSEWLSLVNALDAHEKTCGECSLSYGIEELS